MVMNINLVIQNYFDNPSIENKCATNSAMRSYFKTNHKYVTKSEINRFLNKEISFDEIRDRFQEMADAKTQEEFDKILRDV